jgi:hypothetical protein
MDLQDSRRNSRDLDQMPHLADNHACRRWHSVLAQAAAAIDHVLDRVEAGRQKIDVLIEQPDRSRSDTGAVSHLIKNSK